MEAEAAAPPAQAEPTGCGPEAEQRPESKGEQAAEADSCQPGQDKAEAGGDDEQADQASEPSAADAKAVSKEQLTAAANDAMEMASRLWEELEKKELKSVVDDLRLKADEVLRDEEMQSFFQQSIARLNFLVSREAFDGEWVGKDDHKPRCVISGAQMTWHWHEEGKEGGQSDLEIWAADSVSMVLDKEAFKGDLTPQGELKWSDGDVWVCASRPGSAQAQDKGATADAAEGGTAAPGDAERSSSHLTLLSALRRLVDSGSGNASQPRPAGQEGFSLDISIEEAISSLSRVAAEDAEVQKIVDQMSHRQEMLLALRSEVLQSRAAQVLQEGQARLGEKLQQLQETSITPQLAQMQSRSQRLLTRLATDRKIHGKAIELFTAAQSRLMTELSNSEAMSSGEMEKWLASLKEQLSVRRAQIVESLGSLPEGSFDLRQMVANAKSPEELESQLALTLVRGIQLTGIDGSGTAESPEDQSDGSAAIVPQIPKAAYQDILSTVDEMDIALPLSLRRLLEAQAEGNAQDISKWKDAVLQSLDDDAVVEGASKLVSHSEQLIAQLQELKNSESLSKVVELLEKDLERDVLAKLHEVDTEEMVATAVDALTKAEVRDSLIDKLKDVCLDFILKILPAIHIEKLTGTETGCDWEIEDINFGDFHFRKENVQLQLGTPGSDSREPLLFVGATDISAHFRDLKVTVRQNQFPSLMQTAVADAKATSMSVQLSFAFKPGGTRGRHYPELMLTSRVVSMENLELYVKENQFAAVLNTLSLLFSHQLKGYAEQKIASRIDEHVGLLVDTLNDVVEKCSPLLKKLGWELPVPSTVAVEEVPLSSLWSDEAWHDGPKSGGAARGRRLPEGSPFEELPWVDPGRTFAVRC